MTTKSRPIIMSSDSVRAILENRKSQTRRVMKPQPPDDWYPSDRKINAYWHTPIHHGGEGACPEKKPVFGVSNQYIGYKSPFGSPGDRLWVKETWSVDTRSMDACFYRANYSAYNKYLDVIDWKSPMFMLRKYSRLTLEITNVRCERVQEITLNDAWDEGYKTITDFKEAWDALNSKRKGCSWNDNPWVFVLEFKKIEGGDNE